MKLKFSFSTLAVIFSIAGIVLLQFLANLAEPGVVDLDEVGEHEGETVVAKGVVCQRYETKKGETVLKLAGRGAVVTAVVELGDCQVEPGDKVEVEGRVIKMGDDHQLEVTRASRVKKTGSVVGNVISLENLASCLGEYVQTRGVVSDLTERDTFLIADVFDPASKFAAVWYIYDTEIDLAIGSEVNFTAFIGGSEEGLFLRTYTRRAVEIEGVWGSREMGIRRAFERLSRDRREFMYFPVNVTGYVLYQPDPIFPSLTLSDRTEIGGRRLEVSFSTEVNLSWIDRRDLIMVRGRLVEDEKDMGLVMEATELELVETMGPENLTVEDMAAYPYLYEDSTVRLSGRIGYDPDIVETRANEVVLTSYFISDATGPNSTVLSIGVRDGNSSVKADLGTVWEEVQGGDGEGEKGENPIISGTLRFFPSRMSYAFVAYGVSRTGT